MNSQTLARGLQLGKSRWAGSALDNDVSPCVMELANKLIVSNNEQALLSLPQFALAPYILIEE